MTISIIGRLTVHNPAYVMPSLRKMLIHLLTDLEYSAVGYALWGRRITRYAQAPRSQWRRRRCILGGQTRVLIAACFPTGSSAT